VIPFSLQTDSCCEEPPFLNLLGAKSDQAGRPELSIGARIFLLIVPTPSIALVERSTPAVIGCARAQCMLLVPSLINAHRRQYLDFKKQLISTA